MKKWNCKIGVSKLQKKENIGNKSTYKPINICLPILQENFSICPIKHMGLDMFPLIP